MTISEFNKLDTIAAAKELFNCCGSDQWTSSLMKHFPFSSEAQLVEKATSIWYNDCVEKDWLQSFTHHPKIGDVKSLQQKFAGKEQSGIIGALDETIRLLAEANASYENKFGFIFIVCATGKSADEMLRLLQDRLKNSYEEELTIAMGEQHKITVIRFKKLFSDANFQFLKMSQLTTHVLETAVGKPGKDITIRLLQKNADQWQTIAQGVTNADGRIADLLPPERKLSPGLYKMIFHTGEYYSRLGTKTLYPEVEIQFFINDDTHYHIPLLISPFGYSTYRGS